VTVPACSICGSRRRWCEARADGTLGCWRCWRCAPRPASGEIDIAGQIGGEARIAHRLGAGLDDAGFAGELEAFGAPVAHAWRPLPCRCRACAQVRTWAAR
jgi:hypothetical protein